MSVVNPSFGDTVMIVDPKSPRVGQAGVVDKIDSGAMRYRYRVMFGDDPTLAVFLDRVAQQRDLWYSRDQLQFPVTGTPVPTAAPPPIMADRPSGVGNNRDEIG